jgi:acyl-CoA synthetase (AMP-forming)/AMP-acid ligase II
MSELRRRLDDACRRFAPRLAVVDEDERLTYAELSAEADRLAASLRLAPFEPVIVPVSNRARDLAAFLGVWRAGGVVAPLHRSASEATAAKTLSLTRARFVANGRPDLRLPAFAPAREAAPLRPLLEGAGLIVFSSGTTGDPKGAVVGHRRFDAKLDMIDDMLGFEDGARVLLVLQLTFSFGQWVSLLTLSHGGTLHMQSRFAPEAVVAALARERIHRAPFVPTMLRAMASFAAPGWTGTIMAGGEVLPAPVALQVRATWPEAQLGDIFGLTETGTCDFFVGPADWPDAAGSIGRPGPGIEARIAADGELQIRTPYGMLGYLDQPELTEASFAGGFFRTGDLAGERPDGRVELIGRAKEVIIRAGNKVSPLEVERVFLEHPDVAAALAAGASDARTGEGIHLMVVPRPGAATDAAALRSWAGERLERWKLPDSIHFGAALPTGATGKADRKALRAAVEKGEL